MSRADATPLRVTYFQRQPFPHNYSIERLFDGIRRNLPEDVRAETVVSSFPSKGLLPRLRAMLEARRRQRPGAVNHVTGDVNYLGLLLHRRRTVLTVHDCEFMDRHSGLKAWLYKWFWLRLPVRHAAVVTVISHATKRELLRWVRTDPAKIRVIPNFVGDEFSADPRPFDEGDPLVLQVGTSPNKNLERLSEALRGITCRLLVVGPVGDEQGRLLRSADIAYECLNDLPDEALPAVYRECDLLAFCSTTEGFGLPILEAQATGRPVVTSDRSSMPEVAGGAACLVDPEDVSAIRSAVLSVVNDGDYRRALVDRGHVNVRRFAPGRIVSQYVEMYRSVVGPVSDE